MAYVHRTLEQIRRMKPKTDRTKINRTTDADIRQHWPEPRFVDTRLPDL
jgi:hypothetical protein